MEGNGMAEAAQAVGAGTQVVKVLMEGTGMVFKGSVSGIKESASFIRWLLHFRPKSKLLQLGGTMMTLEVSTQEWKQFKRMSSRYGLSYETIGEKDGFITLKYSDRQQSILNEILKKLVSARMVEGDNTKLHENKGVVRIQKKDTRRFERILRHDRIHMEPYAVGNKQEGFRYYLVYKDSMDAVKRHLEQKNFAKADVVTVEAYKESFYDYRMILGEKDEINSLIQVLEQQKVPFIFLESEKENKSRILVSRDDVREYIPAAKQQELSVQGYVDYLNTPVEYAYHHPLFDAEEVIEPEITETREMQIYQELLSEEKALDIGELKKRTGLSEETVTEVVEDLSEAGIAFRDGLNVRVQPEQAKEAAAYLRRLAGIEERLKQGKTGEEVKLLKVPLPEAIDETTRRMKYSLGDKEKTSVFLPKNEIVLGLNGRRRAVIDLNRTYARYNEKETMVGEISGIQLVAILKKEAAKAVSRTTEKSKEKTSSQEEPSKEKKEPKKKASAGKRKADKKEKESELSEEAKEYHALTFSEEAQLRGRKRAERCTETGIENNFDGALNRNQDERQAGTDLYLADRNVPLRYLQIHTEKDMDPDGNPYSRNDYRVFSEHGEVTASDIGYDGKFTDKIYPDREKYYWFQLKKEMKEKSGMSDDVIFFPKEADLKAYQDKFKASEEYGAWQKHEAEKKQQLAEEAQVQRKNYVRQKAKPKDAFHNFEERPHSEAEDLEFERMQLKNMGVLLEGEQPATSADAGKKVADTGGKKASVTPPKVNPPKVKR